MPQAIEKVLSLSKKSEAHLFNVTVLALSKTVLLRSVWKVEA